MNLIQLNEKWEDRLPKFYPEVTDPIVTMESGVDMGDKGFFQTITMYASNGADRRVIVHVIFCDRTTGNRNFAKAIIAADEALAKILKENNVQGGS